MDLVVKVKEIKGICHTMWLFPRGFIRGTWDFPVQTRIVPTCSALTRMRSLVGVRLSLKSL